MDLGLKSKIALVTGASSGIGAATAEILAAEGADIILTYHSNFEGAKRVADIVKSKGCRTWLYKIDLGDFQSISNAIEDLARENIRMDILILNAGYNQVSSFDEISPDEWNKVIHINLGGPFFLVQALAPLMREGASIVTVASVAAHTGAPHHLHYAAAKAGLVNLTKSLAREFGPHIRVNCIAPGITITPMGEDTIRALPKDYAEEKLPLSRYANPEEIARCIVFVASPINGFMTGATIDINGGREMR